MAKSAIKIRCLTDRDVGSIVGLWNGVLEREKPSWWAGQTDDVRLSAEAFDQAASNPHFAWEDSFVAESSGRIVGFAWGDSCPQQEREKEQNTSAELKGIVVEPDFRRQGIGTRLLKGVESRAQTQGKTQMYVEADVLVESSEYRFLPLVHPEFRRRGIGTVLMHLWGEHVKALGACRSVIATGTEPEPEPENPALRLYLAMGYQKRGEFSEDLAKDLRL